LSYGRGLLNDYPALELELWNLAMERYPRKILAMVDTSFEGDVMLTTNIYKFFRVGELPKSLWRKYATLSGTLVARTARAIAQVDGRRFEVFVESPAYGGGKVLVGRGLLNKLTLVLAGPRKLTCLAEEAAAASLGSS